MMIDRINGSLIRLKQSVICVGKGPMLRAAGFFTGVLAFIWWCVLYPELCFPKDTYEAVYEAEEAGNGSGGTEAFLQTPDMAEGRIILSGEENCYRLLQAEEEQVIVKSRLLEWLKQYGYIE